MRPIFLVFRSRFQRLTPFVLGLLLPSVAAAETAPPTNDRFAGRVHLGSGNIHTNGTMLGASQESGERWGLFFEPKSVWWVWNATNSGPVTITVDAIVDGVVLFPRFLSIEVSIGDSVVQLAQVATGASSVFYDGHLAPSVTFEAVSGQQYVLGLNAQGTIGEYALEVIQGLPPMVMGAAPDAGTVFKTGDSIVLSAQVLDPDSPVSHVTFYAGLGENFSSVGTVQEWPFNLNWSNAPSGHYQVVARGWDTTGLSAFSLPFSIDVVPANDAFADRVALTGTSIDVIGTLANASREEGEPLHADNDLESIWWSWTAPTNGFVTVSSDAWGLAVYNGLNLANLTLVTNGLPGEYGSMAVFAATAGTTYAIAAIGYDEVQLHLRMSRPPIVTILSPTNGARFIVGEAIPVSVSAQDPEGSLASLEVLTPVFDGPVVTNVAAGGFFTTVLYNLPAGGYWIWATATDAEGLSTWFYHPFQVEPVPIPPPLNDHYTNRFTLTGAPLIVTGTTVNATTELGEGGYHSVWWRWVAPASGPTTVTFAPSPHEANIYTGDAASALECVGRPSFFCPRSCEVFQAQAGVAYQIRVYLHVHLLPPGEVRFQILQSARPTVTLIGPTNGSHFIRGETVQLSATVAGMDWGISKVEFFSSSTLLGTITNEPYTVPISFQADQNTRDVYAVVTDTMGWSYQSGTFSYIVHPVPPDNDSFAGRLFLSGSSVSTTGSTETATREAGEPGGGERSVWYSWTAPADGHCTLTADSWLPNLGILAYTGTILPTLALVGASTIEPGPQRYRARLTLDAVAGTLYQIAVIDAGAFNFTISRGRPPSISITSPADGVALLRGSPTAFAVSVNDLDGDLRRVDFYLNNALLGSVTNPPFALEFKASGTLWITSSNLAELFFLDAVATDEQGMETHTVPVTGEVTGPAVHPATNDNFARRILLTGLLTDRRLEQEATASVELGEPDWLGDGGVGSTWWTWRAPAAGEVLVQCEAPFVVLTGQGTVLSNLTLVGISQSNEWIRVCRFSAVAATDYHLRVATDYPYYRLQLLLNIAQPALLSAKGIENGVMRLNFQTVADLDWTFQFSDNLRDWTFFHTNRTRFQNFQVFDPSASVRSHRFYRAVSEH